MISFSRVAWILTDIWPGLLANQNYWARTPFRTPFWFLKTCPSEACTAGNAESFQPSLNEKCKQSMHYFWSLDFPNELRVRRSLAWVWGVLLRSPRAHWQWPTNTGTQGDLRHLWPSLPTQGQLSAGEARGLALELLSRYCFEMCHSSEMKLSFPLSCSEGEVAQSCPTLCDPMDCSLPHSSIQGISRQEYWSGVPFPPPGDLPDPGIKPRSPSL